MTELIAKTQTLPPGGGSFRLDNFTLGVFLTNQPTHRVAIGSDKRQYIPISKMQGWIFSRETEGVCEYDSELSLVTVSIDDKLLHEAGATNISAVRQVGNLDNLLVQLALSAEKFNAGEKIYRETMIRALAAQIVTTITPPITQLNTLDDQRLRRAIEHIHARLGEDLSLENLSIEAGMSSFHFARSFKAATGTSPLQYVILTRMKTAQILLASTKLSITEIAHRVGYEDISRFSQHFRHRIGVSPGEIRKR